jgi:hypothetical protein
MSQRELHTFQRTLRFRVPYQIALPSPGPLVPPQPKCRAEDRKPARRVRADGEPKGVQRYLHDHDVVMEAVLLVLGVVEGARGGRHADSTEELRHILGEGEVRDRGSRGGLVKAELADTDLQGRLNDVSLPQVRGGRVEGGDGAVEHRELDVVDGGIAGEGELGAALAGVNEVSVGGGVYRYRSRVRRN